MPEVKRRGARFQSAQVLGVCKRLMSDKLASEARKSTTCCRRVAVLHLWNCTVQQMIHCRNLWPVAYPHGRAQRHQQCVTEPSAPVTKSFQIVQPPAPPPPHLSWCRTSRKVVLHVFTWLDFTSDFARSPVCHYTPFIYCCNFDKKIKSRVVITGTATMDKLLLYSEKSVMPPSAGSGHWKGSTAFCPV